MGNNWGTGIPVPVTEQLMQRGQQRFNINCSVCHGLTAAGNGVAKLYGLNTVATLQDERIRKMADGEIFNTITNGKNTMMSYGGNVPVADRWAIIAYLRALQRSQNAATADVPPEELANVPSVDVRELRQLKAGDGSISKFNLRDGGARKPHFPSNVFLR